jgi:hypothetical protein
MLLIAIDANFRLKNRIRANELEDPPLGPGWGYWVEPKGYQEHVRRYVKETDVSLVLSTIDEILMTVAQISTCIAFAALLQKDTRMTTGLRVSGVGGCVCARHECMRPNGLGDLQKGERCVRLSEEEIADSDMQQILQHGLDHVFGDNGSHDALSHHLL